MRAIRVTGADGCEWEIRTYRVRLPAWRQINLGSDGELLGGYDPLMIAISLLALPFTLILIPLAIALVELPFTVGRAAFSDTAWVEATSHWPNEARYLWRTTRTDAPSVRAHLAAKLPTGEPLRPSRAELIDTSLPS